MLYGHPPHKIVSPLHTMPFQFLNSLTFSMITFSPSSHLSISASNLLLSEVLQLLLSLYALLVLSYKLKLSRGFHPFLILLSWILIPNGESSFWRFDNSRVGVLDLYSPLLVRSQSLNNVGRGLPGTVETVKTIPYNYKWCPNKH